VRLVEHLPLLQFAHREAELPGQRAEEVLVMPMSDGLRLLALDVRRWQAEEPPQ
jgi:hypothetical protein